MHNWSDVNPLLMVPLVFLIWIIALGTVKKIAYRIIRRLADQTENKYDDLLLDALNLPLELIVYSTGILVAQSFLPRDYGLYTKYFADGFKVVSMVAVIIFADRFVRGMINLHAERVEILRTSGGFAHGFARFVVVGIGLLILLDTFGVSITPIIASLGIGSLAIALALQPTLENFFSGIQLLADKPVQIGHLIKLESGEEGTVVKIGWRSTWVLMPNNNTIIIPNKNLVNSRVINYFYPNPEAILVVPVAVHYASDLDTVERVTLEEARETVKTVDGGVTSFDPLIRYYALADSSINFNVIMRTRDMGSSHPVKHEFIKRLIKRYAQEGIVIPYPTRTIIEQK